MTKNEIKSVEMRFYNKSDGSLWVSLMITTKDGNETTIVDTECDANRIVVNFAQVEDKSKEAN